MGSRGASSKSSAGKYGGGMKGRRTGATPKNEEYLSDQIGKKGGTGFADEIMRTRDSLESVYGESVKDITLMTASFAGEGVLGCYSPSENTVYMNKKYIGNSELTNSMLAMAKIGFHPSIGQYTGAEAVAAHELGHGMADYILSKKGVSAESIVASAGKKIGIAKENMAGHISGYARENYSETVAEACADVYCNGSKANKASKAIMKEVKSYLK